MKLEIEYREAETPEIKTFITADANLIEQLKEHQKDEKWDQFLKAEVLKIDSKHEIAIISVRYCRNGMTKWAKVK